ncbi:glycosyl hydrolase family 28-related protein [Carnobacterium gallinarum]|uniref:glycosyl hydrolase family 28-related protein n=1 Tax=Carnobacterium gallinarum TaxID=2749 RepID=UPI0005585732|nr:glycosyl hydrolase family 28-related protein [Carnobacterium gallinarum]
MSLLEENQRTLQNLFPNYEKNSDKRDVLTETQRLFDNLPPSIMDYQKNSWCKWRMSTKFKTDYSYGPSLIVNDDGQVVPDWYEKLQQEMSRLKKRIRKEVSVTDFGAVGDGVTDCTKAFKRALAFGSRKVNVPEGIFIVKGIKLPSNTILVGAGSTETTIKLHREAPKSQRLITNKQPVFGNHHIQIEQVMLDWNVERLESFESTAAGGTASSGVTLAHVKYAVVRNVVIQNPGLHGIDITAPYYSYLGDGTRSRGGSEYIWLDQIEAYGYGDDGITTHHSQNILISHSYLHHPSGRAHELGYSNSNGIEVDDGSQHVSLVNNRTAYGFGGIEIKAHETSSAASDTQIFGHFSFHDNRSYNFRHIGHHKGEDALSCSAYGIRGSFLAAYFPQKTDLYVESTPRGLVVSAYHQVVINYFVGRDNLDKQADKIAIAVQYRAGNVVLRHINLRNYGYAKQPIRISKETKNIEY